MQSFWQVLLCKYSEDGTYVVTHFGDPHKYTEKSEKNRKTKNIEKKIQKIEKVEKNNKKYIYIKQARS